MREAEAKLEHKKLELMEKIEAQKCDAAREACEAETAKRDAEELLKRDETLEIMERIELEKHDIECEKIDDQLLCDMEKAKLALEQERINSQQFQQQRNYEFKCQLQEKLHENELEKLEAQKALAQPRVTIKAKSPRNRVLTKVKTRWILTY